MNQEAGGRGQTKGKSDKVTQSKTTRAKLHSKGQQQISQLTEIIDNLIYRKPK